MTEVLKSDEIDEDSLVDAWIRLQYAPDEESKKRLIWAHAALDEICDRTPGECLRLILLITKKDRSDLIASNLAAGPVEDLLSRHGPSIIDAVEQEARRSHNFRSLLGGVWRSTIDEDVWNRVQELARSTH
jgi:hypothetical protein